MKKMFFAVNLRAGRGAMRPVLAQVLSAFTAADYRVTVHITQKRGELPDIIAAEAQDYDVIVCAGGDGTLNETVNGLMRCEKRPVLGYLPAGTTNDVASNLNLPKKILDAAKVITDGFSIPIDVSRFNDRYFDYIAAFGGLVTASFATTSNAKNAMGPLAYFLEVAKRMPNTQTFGVHAECDDGKVFDDEAMIGLVSNSLYIAGFSLGEQLAASINDGMMEVIFIRKPPNLISASTLVNSYLAGDFASQDTIFWTRTKKLKLTISEAVPWTLDGEFGGKVQVVDIENKMHAVRIFAPEATFGHKS